MAALLFGRAIIHVLSLALSHTNTLTPRHIYCPRKRLIGRAYINPPHKRGTFIERDVKRARERENNKFKMDIKSN